MALNADGTLIFDTSIDDAGFESGINKLKSSATKAAGIIGAAVGGFAVYATKAGSEFEAAMSQVAAVSGAAGDELDALKQKAEQMGASTKFSATESAEAFNYMAMAGWKTEDMLGGIEGIMNLAAASGADLATTSDIVTDALTAFGLKADDAGHFADVLAAASSNANTNVEMMGETFKYAAPVAGALGFSIEDTAQAIGLMANAGIKGSQAGTALRSMFTRLSAPTDDVAIAMRALGIETKDEEGNMYSLKTIMMQLRQSFESLSEAEQAEYAKTLAGQEAMSGLLAIVNASGDDWRKLGLAIDSASEAEGEAARMAAIMQENLSGQVTIMKSALEGLAIAFYSSFNEPLTDAVKFTADALSQMTNAYKEQGMNGMLAVWKDVLRNILQAITDNAPNMIQGAVDTLAAFLDTIGDNGDKIAEAGVTIVTELAKGIIKLQPKLAEVALKLIVAFAKYIVQNLPQLLPVALLLIEKLIFGIASNIPKLAAPAKEIVSKTVSELRSAVTARVPDIGKQIVNGIIQGIRNGASALTSFIKSWGQSVINSAKGVFGIHSPSKVFKDQIGKNLALGLEEGFDDEYASVASKMKSTIQKQTMKLQNSFEAKGAAPASVSNNSETNIPVTIYYDGTGSEDVDAKRLGKLFGVEVNKQIRSRGVVPG